jgi:hypothetical protein
LKQVKIQKDDVGFDLSSLETIAADTIPQTEMEEELIQSLKADSIKQVEDDSDDNSDDNSGESSDSEQSVDKSESEENILNKSNSDN